MTVIEVPCGFKWGPLMVTRTALLPEDRRVLSLTTPRTYLEVYVTRTGMVRVFKDHKEMKVA